MESEISHPYSGDGHSPLGTDIRPIAKDTRLSRLKKPLHVNVNKRTVYTPST